MNKKGKITESELEVLKIFWRLNKATTREIVSELKNNTNWSPTTIQTLIYRLTNKDILGIEKINKKTYLYYPLITENEYKYLVNESLLNKLYNGSLSMMISTFIKNTKLTDDDIYKLKRILDER